MIGITTNEEVRVVMGDGSGVAFNFDEHGSTVLTPGNNYIVVTRWADSINLQTRLNGTVEIDSAVASFSTSNASNALCLGSLNGGGSPWEGTIADTIILNRVLSNSEVSRLETFLANKHSISLP